MRFSRPMFLSGLMVLVESENTHDNNKSPFLCHLPRNVLQLYDIYGITVNILPQGDLLIESPLNKKYRKVASADDRPACLALKTFKCLPLLRWNNISDPQKKDGRGVLDNKIAIEAQISIRLDRKKQTV
jgi:hypothetical protein